MAAVPIHGERVMANVSQFRVRRWLVPFDEFKVVYKQHYKRPRDRKLIYPHQPEKASRIVVHMHWCLFV